MVKPKPIAPACDCSWRTVFAVAPGAALTGMDHDPNCKELRRPGRWVRASHKTDFRTYEIRCRPDGDFDIREIKRKGYLPAVRGVSADYVRAEFVLPEGVSWSDLAPPRVR